MFLNWNLVFFLFLFSFRLITKNKYEKTTKKHKIWNADYIFICTRMTDMTYDFRKFSKISNSPKLAWVWCFLTFYACMKKKITLKTNLNGTTPYSWSMYWCNKCWMCMCVYVILRIRNSINICRYFLNNVLISKGVENCQTKIRVHLIILFSHKIIKKLIKWILNS